MTREQFITKWLGKGEYVQQDIDRMREDLYNVINGANKLEGEGIPEELKGNSGRYVILMERLIEMQKEMDPVWFKAHALSIVLRAYCRGMDVVYNYFEKLKKEKRSNERSN